MPGIFGDAVLRLLREHWGTAWKNAKGINTNNESPSLLYDDLDSGVQQFADEVYAVLSTARIELTEPIQFTRADGMTGPMMQFFDDSEGPTITIEGDNERTDINIGGINHSVNISNNNQWQDGDSFYIQNIEGDISYSDDVANNVIIDEGDNVTIINPGGGTGGGGGDDSSRRWGKITGEGTEDKSWNFDVYPQGPFVNQTTEVENVELVGATDNWVLPVDLWAEIHQVGNKLFFFLPTLPMYEGVVTANNADTLTVEADGGTYTVAKTYNLRRTPFHNQTVNTITYIYSSNSERIAQKNINGQIVSETQKIVPQYVTNTSRVTFGWSLSGTGVDDVNWVVVGDDRSWAGVCS